MIHTTRYNNHSVKGGMSWKARTAVAKEWRETCGHYSVEENLADIKVDKQKTSIFTRVKTYLLMETHTCLA